MSLCIFYTLNWLCSLCSSFWVSSCCLSAPTDRSLPLILSMYLFHQHACYYLQLFPLALCSGDSFDTLGLELFCKLSFVKLASTPVNKIFNLNARKTNVKKDEVADSYLCSRRAFSLPWKLSVFSPTSNTSWVPVM